jgi:hypothetical protein
MNPIILLATMVAMAGLVAFSDGATASDYKYDSRVGTGKQPRTNYEKHNREAPSRTTNERTRETQTDINRTLDRLNRGGSTSAPSSGDPRVSTKRIK